MKAGARQRPILALKARALRLLAQREQSRAELRRKLLQYATADSARSAATVTALEEGECVADSASAESAAAAVDTLLDWLEACNHLSEQRFVESRVRTRAARHGNLRIRLELKRHQVALPAALKAALESSELDRARDVLARRIVSGPVTPPAAVRARHARFLVQRGFSSDVVKRVLAESARRFGDGADDDDRDHTAIDAS